jgi:hypothetical protein
VAVASSKNYDAALVAKALVPTLLYSKPKTEQKVNKGVWAMFSNDI